MSSKKCLAIANIHLQRMWWSLPWFTLSMSNPSYCFLGCGPCAEWVPQTDGLRLKRQIETSGVCTFDIAQKCSGCCNMNFFQICFSAGKDVVLMATTFGITSLKLQFFCCFHLIPGVFSFFNCQFVIGSFMRCVVSVSVGTLSCYMGFW